MSYHEHRQFRIYRLRGLFLRIGFAITLLLVILAFSWKTTQEQPKTQATSDPITPDDHTIINVVFPKKEKQEKQVTKTEEVTIEVVKNRGEKETPKLPPTEPDFSDLRDMGMPDEHVGNIETPAPIRDWAEHPPKFPGGFTQYILDNIRYPEVLRQRGLSGEVIVKFAIDEKGNVIRVEIAKESYAAFNEEAKRIIKNSPQWVPGRMGDRPVRVWVSVPINFTYWP